MPPPPLQKKKIMVHLLQRLLSDIGSFVYDLLIFIPLSSKHHCLS